VRQDKIQPFLRAADKVHVKLAERTPILDQADDGAKPYDALARGQRD
jgi:hypothetical protein